jgi:predicted GNAT family acetyltransferase
MEKIITQIENLIKEHKFEHFYLYENVLRANEENIEVNAKWLIGDDSSWIMGFCANNNYNIYGINYSKELLDSVVNKINFKELPNKICFSGNKEIILEILTKNPSVGYTVYKDRNFYETNSTDFNEHITENILIRDAEINDLNIVSEFNCDFFEEEYDGNNNKEINEIKFQMQIIINDKKIIVGQDVDELVGFCTRMNTKFDNEMIGTVFVEKKIRNKGFGKVLLSEMTKNILENNKKCWLMTDVKNVSSNKIVEGLGYKKIFEYTSGEIKKTVANS